MLTFEPSRYAGASLGRWTGCKENNANPSMRTHVSSSVQIPNLMRKRFVDETWPPLNAEDAAATIPMPWPTSRWRTMTKRRSKNFFALGFRYLRLLKSAATPMWSLLISESTYASCSIPTVARSNGDNPILEMRVAVELEVPFLLSLICMAGPTTRRVQKMKRYPQPSTLCMPWRKIRYMINTDRTP